MTQKKRMLSEPSRSRKKVIITRADDMRTMQKMKRLMMMNLISERKYKKEIIQKGHQNTHIYICNHLNSIGIFSAQKSSF